MAAASLPELVWTDHSTPPTSSTENESNEAFFALAPQPAQNRKLRKLAHPPPSFHAFAAVNQSDLSFIADEPPLPEQSNFPFIFPGRRSVSVDYERTFRSQSESGHSYAYTRSLESSSSRPATFLSMADSQTPLLRSLSSFGARKSMSNLVPTRKLTKRKPSVSSSQFKPLPALEPEPKSLPMLPPAPPLKLLESIENAPKRRGTISFAFTVALKRRLSMPKNKPNQTQVKVPESEVCFISLLQIQSI
ncbi:hypothetical protein GYMLUDRAFT_285319 [Collybiopsis luxurians FD-317 M1]|nr:hypothetical protein GYMLUDRAFT_285319 [Collybiopsis luxurians FD-317 M1]